MIPLIIKTTVLQTAKRESLDSLTHGGVRGQNFSTMRNFSCSIKNVVELKKGLPIYVKTGRTI